MCSLIWWAISIFPNSPLIFHDYIMVADWSLLCLIWKYCFRAYTRSYLYNGVEFGASHYFAWLFCGNIYVTIRPVTTELVWLAENYWFAGKSCSAQWPFRQFGKRLENLSTTTLQNGKKLHDTRIRSVFFFH